MLNLGTLQFFLGVNTRALEAARGRIETFGRSVENAQRAANRGIDTNIAQMRKVENTTLRALASVNKMQEAIVKAKLAPDVRASMLADIGRACAEFGRQQRQDRLRRIQIEEGAAAGQSDRKAP